MELVKQKDINGCGIACIAMLARCDYNTAMRAFISVGGDVKELLHDGNGTKWGILKKTANALNVKLHHGHRTPRIVMIYEGVIFGGGPRGHWVVIDAVGNKLDPANEKLI